MLSDSGVKKRYAEITYLSHAVGGTQTLCLVCITPGLEQVLEHRRLSTLGHYLHTGAGWVVFGFHITLVEMVNRQRVSFTTLIKLLLFNSVAEKASEAL